MSDAERVKRGEDLLEQYFGRRPDVRKSPLGEDFYAVTVGNVFGDVWSRPGLELRERSMITLAALIALGRSEEFKIHLRGALNTGVSREQIREMIIHLAHYGGWPVAVGSMRAADEVFAEVDAKKDK